MCVRVRARVYGPLSECDVCGRAFVCMCACMCVHVGVRVCGVVLFVHVCGRVLVCVYVCVFA